ncbi:MAG: hypothetical protein V1859_07425 [archaeon]
MQKIKCKNGKCKDVSSLKKKMRSICKEDDIVCNTEIDLMEEDLDDTGVDIDEGEGDEY